MKHTYNRKNKKDVSPMVCPGYRGHPCGRKVRTVRGFCSSRCQGFAFEDLVEDILRSLGYKTDRNFLLDGREVDVIATKDVTLGNVRFLVECKSGPGRKQRIIEAAERLCAAVTTLRNDNKVDFGLLVIEGKPSPNAVSYGASHCVLVSSIDELMSRVIFAPQYKQRLQQIKTRSSIPFGFEGPYVHQLARTPDDRQEDALDLIRDWISKWENGIMVVLGRSGVGKSVLLVEAAIRYLSVSVPVGSMPYPLFVRMRDIIGREKDIRSALLDYWRIQFGLQFPGFDAVDSLLRARRAILLLDGIDELPQRHATRFFWFGFQDFIQDYVEHSQILVSSRNVGVIEQLVGPQQNVTEYIYLEPWSSSQISKYLSSPGQDVHGTVAKLINDHAGIRELAKRPLFLRMLTVLFGVHRPSEVRTQINCPALLYQSFVKHLLHTDRWRTGKDGAQMAVILKELATDAFETGSDVICAGEYSEVCRMSSFFEQRDQRTFVFFHKSMLDYWIAQALVDELSHRQPKMLTKARFSHLTPEFVAQKLISKQKLVPFLLDTITDLAHSQNAVINCVEILGEMNQMHCNCVAQVLFNNELLLNALWRFINDNKDKRQVLEASLNFLSILGSEEAARKLRELYESPDFDYLIDSAFGLEYYGSKEVFIEECRSIVKNKVTHYDRATCAYLLGEYGDSADIDILKNLSLETSVYMKETAFEAMEKIKARGCRQ